MNLTRTLLRDESGRAPARASRTFYLGHWSRLPPEIWRYPAALGVVAVSAGVSEVLFQLFGVGGAARIFTAGVLITAFLFGVGPALLTSAASFLVYLMMTEHEVLMRRNPGEDVLLLTVFLTAAVMTGSLAGRVKAEVTRTRARAETTSTLYEASRELSIGWEEDAMRESLARRIAVAAKGSAVIVEGTEVYAWPPGTAAPAGLRAPEVGLASSIDGLRIRELRSGGQGLGVAAWWPDDEETAADEHNALIDILVDLGAAAIARVRLVEENAEMAALARTQQLQNALLSSISHDFRTPLASILASSSALRELGGEMTPEGRDDLLATIVEESERLNHFVANLLSMMRLDSGSLQVSREEIELGALCGRVVSRLEADAERKSVHLQLACTKANTRGDPALLEQAVFNVVHNAVALSPAGGWVRMEVNVWGSHVTIAVSDEGPGVPPQELERIFDKFYRSPSGPQRPGTGLGLSISRGLIEAMSGRIRALNRSHGVGLRVEIDLQAA
jgi:K+-sensing histidine kinase KdpD